MLALCWFMVLFLWFVNKTLIFCSFAQSPNLCFGPGLIMYCYFRPPQTFMRS